MLVCGLWPKILRADNSQSAMVARFCGTGRSVVEIIPDHGARVHGMAYLGTMIKGACDFRGSQAPSTCWPTGIRWPKQRNLKLYSLGVAGKANGNVVCATEP